MPDQALTKLAAATPLAVGGLLMLLSPIYDRFIEAGAEREFSKSRYLESGDTHSPIPLIIRYTSWAVDVAQAGLLVLSPTLGLIVALNGTTNETVSWIYFAFTVVGFAIFGCTAAVKRPVLYGAKKYGFSRDGKLWLGWTRVGIAAIVLYLGAAVFVFYFA